MKKILAVILTMLVFVTNAGTQAFASDTTDALWSGIVRITNNSTVASVVSVIFSANTIVYIANGYMYLSANNTSLQIGGADVAYMPGYAGSPWAVFAGSMGANTITDGTLYMGGTTDMAGELRYFPGAAGLSVADSASLEPSSNFSVATSAYLDTTANGTTSIIAEKPMAFRIFRSPSVSGNITAQIAGNITQDVGGPLYDVATGAGYQAVGENFTAMAPLSIQYVQLYLGKSGVPTGNASITLRSSSNQSLVTTLGTLDVASISGVTYYTFLTNYDLTEPGSYFISLEYTGGNAGNFVIVYANAGDVYPGGGLITKTGSTWTNDAASDLRFKMLYYGWDKPCVSATSVSSGEHLLAVSANSTHFWVSVDGVSAANTTSVAAVPDNSENWTFGGGATPYIEYIEHRVGGTQKGYWEWEYAATFSDQSGNGNTGTPTFRTSSSDADVSAALISFAPITQAIAPPYTVDDPPDFITGNISVSGGFTSNTTGSTAPGIAVITAVAVDSGTPVPFILYLLCAVGLLVLSFGVSYLMRTGGSTSLVIKLLILLGALGLLIALSIIDLWVLYLFAMLGIGIAFVAANRQFEGTGNTGNNMLGFLIMSWLGLMVVNSILEGVILTTANRDSMNDFLIFQPWSIGDFTLPVPSVRFLTVGLPALMEWDYTAFGGNAQIFTYLMYSISGVVAFVFFMVAMGAAANMFFRSR